MSSELVIGRHRFRSRLIVGTGKYASLEQTGAALAASGADLVTVAIRRIDLSAPEGKRLLDVIPEGMALLPNTAGCYKVEEAILTAHLAREALGTDLIKVEVIGDQKTLMPDNQATLEACRRLVEDGFTVLPYMTDDIVLAQKLEQVGCAAVMPLAAPIGSGLGVRNPYTIRLIREAVQVPVIVDAGVGTASDAALAMELGVDGVLMNTAIARAGDPIKMAQAMKQAVEAGRLAYEAGRMEARLYATASSPLTGLVFG